MRSFPFRERDSACPLYVWEVETMANSEIQIQFLFVIFLRMLFDVYAKRNRKS